VVFARPELRRRRLHKSRASHPPVTLLRTFTPNANERITRRGFLASIAAVVATASERRRKAIALSSGSRTISVRDTGARGDGSTNDTFAFARAVNSLTPWGGTVAVPDGIYLIDPNRSVIMRDNITLALSQQAVLKAIPVSTRSNAVVQATNCANIRIYGGRIVGERQAHTGTSGEWGMGIRLEGCRSVNVEDIAIEQCWGDGIYVGATTAGGESRNITVARCTSRNNRRQGMSITGCIGASITDCVFSDTSGTAPSAGVDLEPNEPYRVSRITLSRCTAKANAGSGLQIGGNGVSEVHADGCHFTANALDGIRIYGAAVSTFTNNVIDRNRGNGVFLYDSASNEFRSNTLRDNGLVAAGKVADVLITTRSSSNVIAKNVFAARANRQPGSHAILIDTIDCISNTIDRNTTSLGGGSPLRIIDHGTKTVINQT
jgi:parallel beta-helix repeat protein